MFHPIGPRGWRSHLLDTLGAASVPTVLLGRGWATKTPGGSAPIALGRGYLFVENKAMVLPFEIKIIVLMISELSLGSFYYCL